MKVQTSLTQLREETESGEGDKENVWRGKLLRAKQTAKQTDRS